MTGYGEVRRSGDGFELTIEVRSVNNRFLKISSKVSEEITHLQNELEEEIHRHVERGSIYLIVIFRATRFTDLYEIDEALLRKYWTRLRKFRRDFAKDQEILLKDLLLLPGVVRGEENQIQEKEAILPVARKGVRDAVKVMIAMREREGVNLEREFRSGEKRLRQLLRKVAEGQPGALLDYQKKLEERVGRLLSNREMVLSPQDLLREVAILAERADISEELARLTSHLDQFAESLEAREPVGRKLDFLVQEMFRESNTMASKSISPDMSRHIVEIKTEVDRLKEQIQNIE